MSLLLYSILLLSSLAHLGCEILLEIARRYKTALLSLCLIGVVGIALLIAAVEPVTTNYQQPTDYSQEQTLTLPPKDSSVLFFSWEKIQSIQPNNPQLQPNPISVNQE